MSYLQQVLVNTNFWQRINNLTISKMKILKNIFNNSILYNGYITDKVLFRTKIKRDKSLI